MLQHDVIPASSKVTVEAHNAVSKLGQPPASKLSVGFSSSLPSLSPLYRSSCFITPSRTQALVEKNEAFINPFLRRRRTSDICEMYSTQTQRRPPAMHLVPVLAVLVEPLVELLSFPSAAVPTAVPTALPRVILHTLGRLTSGIMTECSALGASLGALAGFPSGWYWYFPPTEPPCQGMLATLIPLSSEVAEVGLLPAVPHQHRHQKVFPTEKDGRDGPK